MELLFFALLAGSAPQASTATATSSAAAPASQAAGKKPGLICVDEAAIGSRLGSHRICRTAEEWRRDRLEARDDTERTQRLNKLPGQ